MSENVIQVFKGTIAHYKTPFELEILERGTLVVNNGKIVSLDKGRSLSLLVINNEEIEEIQLKPTQMLIPGFIDCHIHAPQYPNAGVGYDKQLLEWLDTYTYNIEKKYRDLKFSEKVYDAVVKKTLSYGTTTACYFGSLFKDSTQKLVEAVIENGQRAFVGKINMINLSPPDYIEEASKSIADTKDFIKYVKAKNNHLVQPIITPRFAPSVDEPLMKTLGQIALVEDLNIQTHISENVDECSFVKSTFNKGYAQVYDDARLLTAKTVLAHGIYLLDDECKLLAERGTSVAHCPESNTWLKSGICDVRRLLGYGLSVGLGTDVAGGASPSIINAMRAALDASIHLSFQKKDYKPLTWDEAFYLATLGGAHALALESTIGNFELGKELDALVIDVDVENSSCDYLSESTPRDMLQKFIYLGDDRNIRKVYVNGNLVKNLE